MKYLTSYLLLLTSILLRAQTPIYLDPTKDIEARVEDALSRMTLAEKIDVIHAQSKFSSAGVKRLGMPDFWTDDGPHGVRPDVLWDEWEQAGQTNDSWLSLPSPASQHRGIPRLPEHTDTPWARRLCIGAKA